MQIRHLSGEIDQEFENLVIVSSGTDEDCFLALPLIRAKPGSPSGFGGETVTG